MYPYRLNSDFMREFVFEALEEKRSAERWYRHAIKFYSDKKDIVDGFKDEIKRCAERYNNLKSQYESLLAVEKLTKQTADDLDATKL